MKQNKFFILAAAALTLAACSNNDAIEEQAAQQAPQEISFSAYLNRGLTRAGEAGELTTENLKTEGFGVFGYYTDNQVYTASSIPNFFYNQQVTFNTSVWTYSPVKYWPNEFGGTAISDGVDKLTFFAYAPYVRVDPETGLLPSNDDSTTGIMGLTSNTKQGDPMVKYFVDMRPSKGVDLCWGVANQALSAANTVTGATANNIAVGAPFKDVVKPKTGDKIFWNFKHALAKLNVQIDADVDKSAHGTGDEVGTKADGTAGTVTKIYVRSVTFEGFAIKGLLNLNADATAPLWYDLTGNNKIGGTKVTIFDGRRDGKEGQANAEAANETPNNLNPDIIQKSTATDGVKKTAVNLFDVTGLTGDDDAKLAAPIYVIPTGDALTVTIEYDVETADDYLPGFLSDGKTHGSVVKNVITKAVTFNNSGDAAMDAGFGYYIKLHLGLTSVKFDATVTSWADKDTANPWLPVND